jgi:hypothetical protein
MNAEPVAWNVVVVGAWNVNILTPDGIRRRLLKLPEGTPLEVEVSLDRPGPYRILHAGLVVVPSSRVLEVAPQKYDLASILKAGEIARAALEALPETPVSAAGVNIRYQLAISPDDLIKLLKAPIDDAFSDADYTIESGMTRRALSYQPGVINVEVVQDGRGGAMINLNFHRESSLMDDHKTWLERIEEFLGESKRLLPLLTKSVDFTFGDGS